MRYISLLTKFILIVLEKNWAIIAKTINKAINC